jgi:hypothetical protein
MSMCSTFLVMDVRACDQRSEAPPGQDEFSADGSEVYLSRAWPGWPLRLSLDATGYGEAHVPLTPGQVRELARELTAWADEDEQDGKATRSPGPRDPGDAAQAQAVAEFLKHTAAGVRRLLSEPERRDG